VTERSEVRGVAGTSDGRRTLSPFAFVAYGMGFIGAAMLVLTPFLPLAHINLLGETIESRLGGVGWGVALIGLAAAACPGLALAKDNPLWATGMILPGIVAIGWSGWYAFSRIPEMARLADSASLGTGGMLFVFAGPVLLIGGLAAIIATHSKWTSSA
jgi:hypothetical protein